MADAAAVQKQLQQVVDAADAQSEAPSQRSGHAGAQWQFWVLPRHGNDGKIKGWQGRAEMVAGGQRFRTHQRKRLRRSKT